MISKGVRDLALARLSDPVTGFNPLIASLAPSYSVNPFSIDFSDGSNNFFQGDVDIDALQKSTDIVVPWMKMFTSAIRSESKQKFTLFNGPVKLCIEVMLSWPQVAGTNKFCDTADLVEDAITQIFNGKAWATGAALFNGHFVGNYSPVKPGAESWQQLLAFDFDFEAVLGS